MAKYVDQSRLNARQALRGEKVFTVRLHRLSAHIICISLLLATHLVASAPVVNADAWLDRVERSLRRIESAAKYTEPAGAGSKRATKVHNDCIHKSDKEACAKLIWRSPDVLPVRDWAVGTAHIKRGEMREQDGDVAGALEDYRDALGYHQFPSLQARIKTLEKRAKRSQQRAAAQSAGPQQEKVVEARPANAHSTPVAASPQNSAPLSGDATGVSPSHPVVVVSGWGAKLADNTGQLSAGGAARDDLRNTAAPNPTPSRSAENTATSQPAPIPASLPGSVPTRLAVAAEAAPPHPVTPASVVVDRTSPPDIPSVAARFIPGTEVPKIASVGVAKADSGLNDGAPRPDEVRVRTEQQNGAPVHAPLRPENTLQFNVNDEVARSLARVRNKTNEVLTTSALPDRSPTAHTARQRSYVSLTVMAILTLMMFSTFALMTGWRPTFPTVLPRPERKPVLSVEDIEGLIKTRSAELGVSESSARLRRHPKIGPVARAQLPQGMGDAARRDGGATVNSSNEDVQARADDATPIEGDAVENSPTGYVQPRRQSAVDVSRSEVSQVANVTDTPPSRDDVPSTSRNQDGPLATPIDPAFERVDTSLLRRVSYGAASVVVVGTASTKACTDSITAKVDAARRPDLLQRVICLDETQADAQGVLNPFCLGVPASNDPLVLRQRFNAAFEFYGSIFEGIFGARFVYEQKSMLRYLVMLLQAMPIRSLKTFYDMLAAPRALEPFHDALLEIDNVSARLFFTTVFSSEEFSETADYMRTRLAPIIGHELVAHLCCGQTKTDPFAGLEKDGALVLLALQKDDLSALQRRVLVRCLLSVLALRSPARTLSDTGDISSSLFLPRAKQQIGGSPADAAFLLGQVQSAGYHLV